MRALLPALAIASSLALGSCSTKPGANVPTEAIPPKIATTATAMSNDQTTDTTEREFMPTTPPPEISSDPKTPQIDREAPTAFQTATFALG